MSRTEKIQADDILGPPGCGRNPVDVQRRCICCQDDAFLAGLIQLAEYFLLNCHVFENGFDYEVDVAEVGIVLADR